MSYSSEVLADSPWGFWKCDETGGGTLADSSGNSRPMTVTGTVTYSDPGPATGVTAIKWPANSSTRGATSASNTNSDATLECWVMLTALPSATMPLIGDQQSFGSGTEDKQIGIQSDGKVKFYLFNGAQRTLVSPSALSLNVWHHIVGTVGAAGMDLRIDRSVVASNGAVVSSFTGGQLFFIRPASAQVGLGGSGVATIADVAYYTTQLSTTRTNAHYDQYVTPPAAIAGVLPALTGSLAGNVITDGFVGGVIPALHSSLAGTVVLTGYSAVVLADNPIAYWRLDEPSGAAITDSSGHGHDGAFVGSLHTRGQPSLVDDGVGDPATLLGGGYAAVPLDTWQDVSALTVELWMRREDGAHGPLVTRMNYSAPFGRDYVWQILLNADDSFTAELFRNNGIGHSTFTTATGLAPTFTDIHVVLTYDPATNTGTVYINGAVESTGTLTAPLTNNGASGIAIGSDWANHGTNFSGFVDEVAIYDTALSAAKVLSHYHAGIGAPDLTATLAGHVPALSGSLAGNLIPITFGTIDGHLPGLTGSLAGIEYDNAVLDGQIVSTASHHDQVLALTPAAYYRMDEASGSTMVDSSGNGRDGTYSGVTLGAGPLVAGTTRAAAFGAASSATVPDDTWMDTTEWSVEFWVDYTASGTASLVGRGVIPSGDTWLLQVVGTNVEADFCQAPDTLGGTTGGSLTTSAVHQVVATIDAAKTVRLYLDGVLVDTDSSFVGSARALAGDLLVGANGIYGSADMTMADLALYDYALDDHQVADLYATGSGPGLRGSLEGVVSDAVVVDGHLPALTGDLVGELAPVGAIAGHIPALSGSLAGDVTTTAIISGHVPALTGGLVGLNALEATVDGRLPALHGDLLVVGNVDGPISGQIPALSGSLTGTFPVQTERSRGAGRVRLGLGAGFYTPPVVEPPTFSVAQHAFVSVRSYETATMSGTRPVFAGIRTARARRAFDRIVVGGHDVTYFRGVPTPPPSYALVVPLLYGTATLELPQVSAVFEHAGVGELSWARKGAKVLVQRVDPDTLEVLATDYKGIVVAHDISGRNLRLEIGGEATGRAALIDKQPPLFFKRNDLGFWWWGGIQDLGLPFEPRLGPDTGIVLRNAGGMDHLSYLQDLSAKGARRNGAQLTCMPDAHEDGGAYRVVEKDLESIHATVYLDDSLSVPDVRDDMAEQPNRVFATGVTPEGMRVKFGAYPVLRSTDAPPYPFDDHRHFGVGTEDADTDTGDGVSVMVWRLVKTGFLALIDKPGGFDDDVADAIRDLKENALSGPTFIDGDMTPQAWDALFDVTATDYSLAGTQILPAAQRSSTRKWDRSANGSVIGRNSSYDPSVIPVDATIDTGVGMTRKQDRGFARSELTPVDGVDYVGTITLSGGAVVRGEHTPGDVIPEEDVMDARELRPMMNLRAPLFASGTLFHITGIDRQVDGQGVSTVVLDVDTRARDTMKVWEVIRRNRESRRNPARAWLNQHRSSALTKDAVGEFDEIGGVLDDRVDLDGGAWTVFAVVAGQEGTIRSLRLETSPPTEFVVAVFGKEIKPARLAALIGNPLTKGGKKRWVAPAVRARLDADHVLLYAAGEKRDPCGYYPGQKHPDDTTVDTDPDDATEAPDMAFLTGDWQDDAGFSYHTFEAPVLWVAVWAADAAHLSPGRVMWPQLEAGS